MVEWKHSPTSYFVTLTYANPYLRFLSGKPQLIKSDLQKYFKRVRKAGHKFRYYAVGEYGSQTYRPHYHVLIFGTVPEHALRQAWDKGIVHVGNVTLKSVVYCAKYVINSKNEYMKVGRTPPFAVMSKRHPSGKVGIPGGIGYQYLTQAMKEWHKSDRKNYMVVDGSKRHLPRYYKEKMFSKIDLVRISNRAQRDSLESLRAELLRLGKHHPNAMEYREQRMLAQSKRIRDKSRQFLTI